MRKNVLRGARLLINLVYLLVVCVPENQIFCTIIYTNYDKSVSPWEAMLLFKTPPTCLITFIKGREKHRMAKIHKFLPKLATFFFQQTGVKGLVNSSRYLCKPPFTLRRRVGPWILNTGQSLVRPGFRLHSYCHSKLDWVNSDRASV